VGYGPLTSYKNSVAPSTIGNSVIDQESNMIRNDEKLSIIMETGRDIRKRSPT
jgi:hypothetical protein